MNQSHSMMEAESRLNRPTDIPVVKEEMIDEEEVQVRGVTTVTKLVIGKHYFGQGEGGCMSLVHEIEGGSSH